MKDSKSQNGVSLRITVDLVALIGPNKKLPSDLMSNYIVHIVIVIVIIIIIIFIIEFRFCWQTSQLCTTFK